MQEQAFAVLDQFYALGGRHVDAARSCGLTKLFRFVRVDGGSVVRGPGQCGCFQQVVIHCGVGYHFRRQQWTATRGE